MQHAWGLGKACNILIGRTEGYGKIVPTFNLLKPLHENVCKSGGIAVPFMTSALGEGEYNGGIENIYEAKAYVGG
jgi:hypothetical protein